MISFPIPAGFQFPEGVEEGQDFDAVGTFTRVGNALQLKAIDDAPLSEEAEDEAPAQEETPDEENFMSAVEKRMTPA